MGNIVFHMDVSTLITFLIWDTKIKMTPSCSPHRTDSEHVLFDTERSIWEFDLRSGQVKVRSWPKYVIMHITRSGSTSHVVWHHLRYLHVIATHWQKRTATPFDLRWPPRDPNRQLHSDHHRWGEWPWSWNDWYSFAYDPSTASCISFGDYDVICGADRRYDGHLWRKWKWKHKVR